MVADYNSGKGIYLEKEAVLLLRMCYIFWNLLNEVGKCFQTLKNTIGKLILPGESPESLGK